jgi:hypothetical protein
VFSLSAFGQTKKATTEDGKAVILNENGTWTYAASTAVPIETTATVYVYRLKESGVYNKARGVMLDGTEIFELRQNDFAGFKVAPGKHILRTRKDDSEIQIECVAGKSYFINLVIGYGGFNQTQVLNEVSETNALFQLKKTNFLDLEQLKVKNLILVKEKPE